MLKDLNGKNVEVLPKSRKKFFENGLSKITQDEYAQMEELPALQPRTYG